MLQFEKHIHIDYYDLEEEVKRFFSTMDISPILDEKSNDSSFRFNIPSEKSFTEFYNYKDCKHELDYCIIYTLLKNGIDYNNTIFIDISW